MVSDFETIEEKYNETGAKRELTGPPGDWLDASKIDALNLCPRRFFYRYELHLVALAEGDASAITFGNALHKSMETIYTGSAFELVECPLGPCDFCKDEMIPALYAAFLANYPRNPDDPKSPRTQANGIEILYQYLLKYGKEPFRVLAPEQPFEIEFGDFKYIGRMDLVIEQEGQFLPMDHKSTTKFGTFFAMQYKLSTQITGYMKGVSLVTGQLCTQALVNAIRVTTRINPDESFQRIYTTRTPEELDEWETKVRDAMERIRRHRETGYWPQHAPYACSAYNRQCEFFQLCTAGRQTRRVLIDNAYRIEPWDPTVQASPRRPDGATD